MTLRLNGSTSGYTEIDAPAVGANNLLTLPSTPNGTLTATDSSGRLLVGTSTARSNFFNTTLSAALQVEGTTYSNSAISIVANGAAGASDPAPVLAFGRSRGALGGQTVVTSGDSVGLISFQGSDGSEFVELAQVQAYVDGTPGANDMPGRLVFSTTADGASSPTERMRIDGAGNIAIGRTKAGESALAGTGFGFNGPSTDPFFAVVNTNASGGNACAYFNRRTSGDILVFRTNNGSSANTTVGAVSHNGSSTTYSTSSDYRLKENVVPLTGAADRLKQLPVRRFNFKVDPTTTVDGFIAHEAQAVVPECVTGTKDAVDADGNPVYQGIDQSKLVPLLTAALQEALAKIETLEAKVAALEAQP